MALPNLRCRGVRAAVDHPLHSTGGASDSADLDCALAPPRLAARTIYSRRIHRTIYFSSNTRSSMGRVIFTLLPSTSTTTSSPVVECPVDRMKNLSAA